MLEQIGEKPQLVSKCCGEDGSQAYLDTVEQVARRAKADHVASKAFS
jgi:hypothetical protein